MFFDLSVLSEYYLCFRAFLPLSFALSTNTPQSELQIAFDIKIYLTVPSRELVYLCLPHGTSLESQEKYFKKWFHFKAGKLLGGEKHLNNPSPA